MEIIADAPGAILVRDDRCVFMDAHGRDYRPPHNPIPSLEPRGLSPEEVKFLETPTILLALKYGGET